MSSVECACLLAEQRRLRRPDLEPAVGPVPDSSTGQYTLVEVDGRVDIFEALDDMYRGYLDMSGRAGSFSPSSGGGSDPLGSSQAER